MGGVRGRCGEVCWGVGEVMGDLGKCWRRYAGQYSL